MIQPVIALVPHQAEKVARLVKHCRALDGTEVKIIPVDDSKFTPAHPHNELACRSAWSLRTAALEMKGRPFFWLEPDSTPLVSGWLKILCDEYERGKKPFMLSSDTHGLHDIVGGIGIYSGETHFLIPTDFKFAGWDLWMVKNLKPLIHFTPLIQHSYGKYGLSEGRMRVEHYHRFPRDLDIIRENSVIFHADKNQDLIYCIE